MKKRAVLLLCLALVGCATSEPKSLSQAIVPNRTNLLRLSIGMTKTEVLTIMGTKSFSGDAQTGDFWGTHANLTINNPYRSEILEGKDKIFEVIYYVTDVKGESIPTSDDELLSSVLDKSNTSIITDDNLTPCVFDNGKLIGWGRNFLNALVKKYEIKTI